MVPALIGSLRSFTAADTVSCGATRCCRRQFLPFQLLQLVLDDACTPPDNRRTTSSRLATELVSFDLKNIIRNYPLFPRNLFPSNCHGDYFITIVIRVLMNASACLAFSIKSIAHVKVTLDTRECNELEHTSLCIRVIYFMVYHNSNYMCIGGGGGVTFFLSFNESCVSFKL